MCVTDEIRDGNGDVQPTDQCDDQPSTEIRNTAQNPPRTTPPSATTSTAVVSDAHVRMGSPSTVQTVADNWSEGLTRIAQPKRPRPAEDCDSDRAYYEMLPKPGGSYEVRLFTCVECGHKWRES